MKFLKQGLALAVVGVGLTVLPTVSAQAQPSQADPGTGLAAMKQTASGPVDVVAQAATGKIGSIRVDGAGDLLPDVAADSGAEAARKADAYLDSFAQNFGSRSTELAQTGITKDVTGWTVSYSQRYRGVEVFGSRIKANVDTAGDLTSVNGYAAPALDLSVDPRFGAAEAGRRAVAVVTGDPARDAEGNAVDTSGVKAKAPRLVVYRLGAVQGLAGKAVLAYQVEVTNESNVRDMVVLDADTGKPVNRYSMAPDALERQLYEAGGTPAAPTFTQVWEEGQEFPGGLNQDQQNLVNSAGESYWLYSNAFDRDSYDGAGAPMITVNNDPRISCPNANWNGVTTNYCNGVTSDDVVSHEWGHAYTEYTSGLIYQFQSGALNESYSDVWGETLDLINGREDEGENFQDVRPVGECDATAPPSISFEITAPAGVAGPCFAVAASNSKPFTTTAVGGQLVVATDAADAAGPSTTDGCSTFANAAAIAGNWAYADRGTCPFTTKVANAKAAGATGIVLGNSNVDAPASFTGDPDLYGAMVSQADGTRIKGAGGPVTVSVTAEDLSQRVDSTRWLVGEKSTAFGGAIRDMWSPTCYGDPGKVTDAEYKCDPLNTDAGGVHSNSGVPNHAYALVVDGGSYNGQTVAGIGLDKAAAIWWRAQSAYLVPQSNFSDAADGLEASCTDLVGQPIRELTTEPEATPVAAEPIAAGDCASVAAAMTAVEMRTEPVRCDFQPLLAQGAPALCGEGYAEDTIWSEDFEDGLAGWRASSEVVYEGGLNEPWTVVSDAPTGNGEAHASKVAYGPAPNEGQCSGAAGDFSSRDSITGPVIELPDRLRSPRMSFEHYVATEAGYDGGNVKVSVNGGAFAAIPAEAYVFNAPLELAAADAGNTNPLAGEPGFTGTDGGQTSGSWGESQVDVAALGVAAGDTVQFRFDIGRDGCGGNDGWYVDNIALVQCKLATTIEAVREPDPTTYGQDSSVIATVERDGNVGATPSGTVEVTDEDGELLGEGELSRRGRVEIDLPSDLPVGTHVLTVTYLGTGSLAPASTEVSATVNRRDNRAKSRLDLDLSPSRVDQGSRYRAEVEVHTGRSHPSGVVELSIDGRVVGRERLDDGEVSWRLRADLSVGRHEVTAEYLGNTRTKPSSDDATLRVERRRR